MNCGRATGWLRSRGQAVPVERVVLRTHGRAQQRSCAIPTVHICASVPQIRKPLNASTVAVSPADRAELAQLIVKDHHFRARRRSP